MTKIIVHMGLHRTATTTLQTSLRALRPSLQKTAVILREDMDSDPRLDMRRWHHSGLLAKLKLWRRHGAKHFADAIRLMDVSKVIVSEENLIGTMPGVQRNDFYPHFKQFSAQLKRLDSLLKVYPRLVVRRQDHFMESVYAFRVARGLKEDFPTFLAGFKPDDFDWNRLADCLSDFGDRTQIAVLEEWREAGNVAENALAFVGVYAEGLGRGRGNRRLSSGSIAIMLAFNRAGLLSSLDVRKKMLFPLLVDYEKRSEDVIGVLEALPLTSQQRGEVLACLKAAPQVSFDPKARQAFTDRLSATNQHFLVRPEVLSSPDIWR